jgi:hypothetical protein
MSRYGSCGANILFFERGAVLHLTPIEMEQFPMAIVLTFLWTKAKGK